MQSLIYLLKLKEEFPNWFFSNIFLIASFFNDGIFIFVSKISKIPSYLIIETFDYVPIKTIFLPFSIVFFNIPIKLCKILLLNLLPKRIYSIIDNS